MHKQKGAPGAKPTITVATIAVASGVHEEERHDAASRRSTQMLAAEQALSLEALGDRRNEDRAGNAHDREEGNAGGDR